MSTMRRITRNSFAARARLGCGATALALALAALGAGLPSDGAAQEAATYTLPVAAGEHDGYSRVVVQRPRGAAWEVTSVDRGVEIRFDEGGFDFDAEAVLGRRAAHRVVSMETIVDGDATVLRFGFNCDCEIETATLGGRKLMIDISSRPELAAASGEGAASERRTTEPKKHEAPTREAKQDDGDGPKRHQAPERQASDANASSTEQEQPTAATASDDASGDDTADQVARAQRALLEQLRKAADEGLIAFKDGSEPLASNDAEASSTPNDVEANPTATKQASAVEDVDQDAQQEIAAVDQGAAINQETDGVAAAATPEPQTETLQEGVPELIQVLEAAQSDDPVAALEALAEAQRLNAAAQAADDDAATNASPEDAGVAELVSPFAADIEEQPVDVGSLSCLPDNQVNPSAWNSGAPFFEELSRRRRVLYDASYLVDENAVAALARFYISHGLAHEARATSRSFGVSTEDTRLVDAMADVLLGRPPKPGDPFSGLVPCPGRHGVWQAASLAEIAPEAAMAAFYEAQFSLPSFQPPHRRALGARIARAAASTGDIETAIDIMELLRRNSEPPSNDMLWAEATLELEHGSIERGRRVLEQIVATRDDDAPLAAAALADTYGADAPLDEVARTTGALDDFSLQYRGSSIGARVVEAQAALVARFGDLPGAAHILKREAHSSPAYASRLARARANLIEADIAAALAEPTSERLSAALKAAELLKPSEGAAMRIALAETLVEQDAHALAAVALPPALAAQSSEARDVLARAAAASRLVPSAGAPVDKERPIDALRRSSTPPVEPLNPVGSGRAIVDVVDKELELLREIARP